jgi:hypothetical protein
VVDPDKAMDVPRLAMEEDRKEAFEAIKANTILGVETRIPQPVPPGTSEAGVGTMEEYIVDLSTKDYFLKTLDRPHYPGEDENGNPPWMKYRRSAPPAPEPQKPKQQADAGGIASAALP